MEQINLLTKLKELLDKKKFNDLKNQAIVYLKQYPSDLAGMEFLGFAYFSLNELKASYEVFKKALIINPNSFISLLSLARIECINKQFNHAASLYNKLIKLYDKDYSLLIEYSRLLIDIKKFNIAIEVLKRAIDINDNLFEAHSLMGLVFLKCDKFINAINYYKRSILINPNNDKDLSNLGLCFYKLEKLEKAKTFFLKAVEINPNYSTGYSNLGLAYQSEGNFSEAIKCYEKCLEINPNDCETYRLLSSAKKLDLNDARVSKMIEIYSSNISQLEKMLIGFGLAKVMEDNKKYDESASYLENANALRRDSFSNFNIKVIEDQFNLIENTFTKHFFKKNKFEFSHDITPIFILGMPRSGTTLAEQIISSHPNVHGCGEINDLTESINDIFPQLDSATMLNEVKNAEANMFDKIGRKYLSRLKYYSNHKVFTDKMPFNFKVLGLIKVCLPNAKIIHCYRSPNDNLLSIYKNYFSTDIMPWAYNKIELKKYYNLYRKLMAHYREVLGEFIFDLNYESLTTHPKQEITKILTFCNLDWNDSCLNIENNNKAIFTASVSQAREKINTNSHSGWKKFEKYIPELFFKE